MTTSMQSEILKKKRLSPILKWTGGKEQELKYIHPLLPQKIDKYYEPFIGGGAVYFSLQLKKMIINDKSQELISLYNAVKKQDKDFFIIVKKIIYSWNLLEEFTEENSRIFIDLYFSFSQGKISEQELSNQIDLFMSLHSQQLNKILSSPLDIDINKFLKEIKDNLVSKIKRIIKNEKKKGISSKEDILNNIEASLKSAFYMYFRFLYNNINQWDLSYGFKTAIFFFIRNYAYGGMFRYNKKGDFNVPYGGIGYNRKNFAKKIEYLQSPELISHLQHTTIDNLDFEDFFNKYKPKADDFIFLDPPYDSTFSTYAKNQFTKNDQKRLASYLVNKCEAKWMMVIKNTDFIYNLYNHKGINIRTFDKKYLVNFQNRNDRDVEHLIIANYKI